MMAQFLSDGSDFRSRGGGQFARRRQNQSMFWWTIAITLLVGLAAFCWIFSIMVFAYPERPFNYRLLTKLHKLEPLVEFEREKVPSGDVYGPRELLEFSDLSRGKHYSNEQLAHMNSLWKRAYIFNYKEERPKYVKGTWLALSTRPLTEKDVMNSGWVVRARAVDLQDVELELLLPGADPKTPPCQAGDQFMLDNKRTFTSILHVQRTDNDGVCATVVPIIYGSFAVGGNPNISLEAPDKLNMSSRWPMTETVDVPVASRVAAQAGS